MIKSTVDFVFIDYKKKVYIIEAHSLKEAYDILLDTYNVEFNDVNWIGYN